MKRKDILNQLTRLGLTKNQAQMAVDGFFNSITDALRAGKKVSIVGLGSWEWKSRPARQARNPRTGKVVQLLARKTLVFKPSQLIKDKLNADHKMSK